MNIKIKTLYPDAIIPTYATPGAACFDLYAIHSGFVGSDGCVFHTGLSFEIPNGHVMLVYSRSGHGFKESVRLSNCTGVIDSDYRGEVMVKLVCDKKIESFIVEKGDRIAQAMVMTIQQVHFEEVPNLNETMRGEGGFGSTGA
jgi:dUTP pyrophosphatase